MKWACSQQVFKQGLLGFGGQAPHTLPCARSTHDVCTSSKSWIQPLLSEIPWLEPAGLEITAVCSEGFAPLMSTKLTTETKECSTPDTSVFHLWHWALLPRVGGLSHSQLVKRLPIWRSQGQCFHLVQALCEPDEHFKGISKKPCLFR